MSDCNKDFFAKTFLISGDSNFYYIILIVNDIYDIEIDYSDIQFVSQQDFPLIFDAMIYQFGRTGQKDGQAIFIFFIAKWGQIKDLREVEDRIAKKTAIFLPTSINFRPFNINSPKFSSFFAQLSLPVNTSSNIDSKAGFDIENNEKGNVNDFELLAAFFSTKSELKNQKVSK